MKSVKFILCCILIMLAVITSGELYQNYISTFMEDFYCVTYYQQEGISDEEMISEIFENAKEHQLSIFFADKKIYNSHKERIQIYCDKETKSILEKQFGIIFGETDSLFSGSNRIECFDYKKLDGGILAENNTFYLIGDYDDMVAYKSELADKYAGAFPKQDGSHNYQNMRYQLGFIWGIAIVIICFLTLYDSLLQKKENFVKISFGENISVIVLRNVLVDIGLFMIVYFFSQVLLYKIVNYNLFFSTQNKYFLVLCICNSLLYCNLYFYNMKKVLANNRISQKILFLNYIIKGIANIAAVLLVSINIAQIYECSEYYKQKDFYQKYKEYSYVNFLSKNDTEKLEQAFYETYKDECNIMAMGKDIYLNDTEQSGVIIANKSSLDYYQECFKTIDFQKYEGKNIILIPKEYDLSQEDMEYLKVLVQYDNVQVIKYNEKVKVVTQNMRAENQSEWILNPIIVCDTNEEGTRKFWYFSELLVKIEDAQMQEFVAEYGYEDNYTIENVWENFNYHWGQMKRTLLLNTVLMIIIIGLSYLVNLVIMRLEYQVNAMELATKKILGYSIWQRNYKVFLLTIILYGVTLAVSLILSAVLSYGNIMFIMIGNAILFLLDILTLVLSIWQNEKERIVKILKGGCL